MGRLRILVIDDEAHVRDALKAVLEHMGADVRTAPDGDDALAALVLGYRPDLVLCDIRMPHGDGFAFVRRVRERAELAGLPVVAVTGHIVDRRGVRAAGFDALLTKPMAWDDLTTLLERVASRRAA